MDLVELLATVLVLGAAGALLGAMIAAAVGLDLNAIAQAAWSLISRGMLGAAVAGIAAAVVGGLIVALFDRQSALPIGAVAGLLVFAGYSLYQIVQTSWGLSPWGSGIGAALGCVLGGALGLSSSSERRTPASIRRAARRLSRAEGTHPTDVEWWRAETGDDADDGDAD